LLFLTFRTLHTSWAMWLAWRKSAHCVCKIFVTFFHNLFNGSSLILFYWGYIQQHGTIFNWNNFFNGLVSFVEIIWTELIDFIEACQQILDNLFLFNANIKTEWGLYLNSIRPFQAYFFYDFVDKFLLIDLCLFYLLPNYYVWLVAWLFVVHRIAV